MPVWKTEALNIGGNNLSNVNFANLSNQVKFINTLKYYQKCLAQLSTAVTIGDKTSKKFSNQKNSPNNFSNSMTIFTLYGKIWLKKSKKKILDVIVARNFW